jgi:hypothetical protein
VWRRQRSGWWLNKPGTPRVHRKHTEEKEEWCGTLFSCSPLRKSTRPTSWTGSCLSHEFVVLSYSCPWKLIQLTMLPRLFSLLWHIWHNPYQNAKCFFFPEFDKLILKFIRNFIVPQLAKTILKKNKIGGLGVVYMPIIPTTQEVEIRRITVWGQRRPKNKWD